MDTILILVRQILQMFILAGLGYLLFRTGKITLGASKSLGNILIWLALPAVIINGFLVKRTPEHTLSLLCSGGAAAVLLLLSILLSRWVFGGDAIAAFAGAFANPGFFGIPLIIASVGKDAVFCVACFVAFLNIGQWTCGVSMLNGQPIRKGFQAGKLIRAPFIIAILIGLLLYFTQLRLPELVTGCLNTVAAVNTPLAMFVVGVYMAQTDIPHMLKRRSLYLVSLVRLLLIPLCSLLLLTLLPESMHDMKAALLIASSCPVGVNVAVYAQLHNKDYTYAVETVVISTLFSVLTIPLTVWLASMIW